MKKNKKKNQIIILLIVVTLLVILCLLFFYKNSQLVLKCQGSKETTEYFTVERSVNVYKKSKQILYNDNITLEKLTDNKEINEALDSYFDFSYNYDEYTKNDFLTLNKDGNVLSLVLDINLSNYSASEVKDFIGVSDISIKGLREFLESEGMLCEEY